MFAAGKALREALLAFVRLVEGADQHVAGEHIAVEPPSNADIFRALRHVVAAKSTSVSLLGSQLFAALLRSSPATEAVSRATYPARAPARPQDQAPPGSMHAVPDGSPLQIYMLTMTIKLVKALIGNVIRCAGGGGSFCSALLATQSRLNFWGASSAH